MSLVPYPGQFVRLVMIGKVYTEDFNMTLSIVPSGLGELLIPAVDETTLTSVANAVAAWFPGNSVATGPNYSSDVKLVSIKLNRIGPDGRYVDNIAREHVYPSPISGGITMASGKPVPQVAHVVTLRTAIERGRGSKGRVYTPPSSQTAAVQSDGRVTAAQAASSANSIRILINSLNAVYTLIGKVGVASNAGAGRFEHVTQTSAGRVLDTMRSRRSSLLEDYTDIPL